MARAAAAKSSSSIASVVVTSECYSRAFSLASVDSRTCAPRCCTSVFDKRFRLFALFFSEAVIVARANASQNFSDEKPDDQAGINNQQTEKGRRWITR